MVYNLLLTEAVGKTFITTSGYKSALIPNYQKVKNYQLEIFNLRDI